jgi:hypothetical protein
LTIRTEREQYVSPNRQQPSEPDRLEAATDEAIAACGDARGTVKTLIAERLLEALVEELRADVSKGYARGYYHGRFNTYTG